MSNGLTVLLSNDSAMKATHSVFLNTESLPAEGIIIRMFPAITKSLLHASAVCIEGGKATLMNKEVHVACKSNIVLKGKRGT